MIEVKKIYMDLKEAKKDQGRDVWVLESELFKDPITLQLEYSDHDKERMNATKQWVAMQVAELHKVAWKIEWKEQERKELISKYKDQLKVKEKTINELVEKLEKSEKNKTQVLQEIKVLREALEVLSGTITHQAEQITKLEERAKKEPRVFSWQTFISWNGASGLTAINIPNGNYIVSEVTKIVEKNEYVENEDREINAYNLHVTEWVFIPEYELIGTTKLDTPTATVDRTFTLIPY